MRAHTFHKPSLESLLRRLAIITDIHADVHALRDAFAQIERLGCDQIICAGDLVDYGLFPDETIRLLMERGVPCIRGNHDRWAVEQRQRDRVWTVSYEAITFLRRLPVSWSARIEGVRVAAYHARPGSDMNGIYGDIPEDDAAAILETAACDVLIVGHTHTAFERRVTGGRLVCNPGCLLRDPAEPMDVPTRGTFGILELPSTTFTVHSSKTGEVRSHTRAAISSDRRVLLWLDDERPAPAGWTWVRTASEAIDWLSKGTVLEISMDHDLGDNEVNGTGYGLICWIEEAVAARGFVPPSIQIHSRNAAGRERMKRAVVAVQKRIAFLQRTRGESGL